MLCLCPRLGCVGGWTKDNTDAAAWLTRRSCNGLSKAGPLEHGGGKSATPAVYIPFNLLVLSPTGTP